MINPGSQIPEALPLTCFAILSHANMDLVVGNVKEEGGLIYHLIITTQLPALASFLLITAFPFPERGRCVLTAYACGSFSQEPAKGLPGFMGGLELTRGA